MLSERRDNMNYARWATKEEIAKRLRPVNLQTGIEKVENFTTLLVKSSQVWASTTPTKFGQFKGYCK